MGTNCGKEWGMSKTKPIPPEMDEWRRYVDFNFGGEGGLPVPEGFGNLTVNDEVSVLVTGKVRSIRQDKASSGFSLTMSSLQLNTGGKKSIGGTLDKIKESRKKG
jgi:hypothetical protein